MPAIIGRAAELAVLTRYFTAVATGVDTAGDSIPVTGVPGQAQRGIHLCVTGSAPIGKTRLLAEFVRSQSVPSVVITIAQLPEAFAVQHAVGAVLTSDLPEKAAIGEVVVETWAEFFRALARVIPDDQPTIVVIDDIHYLPDEAAQALAHMAEQLLIHRRVLLVFVIPSGSDGDREPGPADDAASDLHPLRRRWPTAARIIKLDKLGPAEIARASGLGAIAAFDAFLLTGGLPGLVAAWPHATGTAATLDHWLTQPYGGPLAPLERTIATIAPPGSTERALLAVMARGVAARTAIGRAADIPPATTDRALRRLIAAEIVTTELPLSAEISRETRYRITSSALAWYLQFAGDYHGELAAGNSDHTIARATAAWPTWRAGAMVTVARETLGRVAAGNQLPGAQVVGGYWTRSEDTVVDLVGTDGAIFNAAVAFIGAVKWSARDPFSHTDLARVMAQRSAVPGAHETTPIVIVTMAGSVVGDAATATLGPDDLLQAWAALAP